MAGYLCPIPIGILSIKELMYKHLSLHYFFANYLCLMPNGIFSLPTAPCLMPNGVSVCGNKKTAD